MPLVLFLEQFAGNCDPIDSISYFQKRYHQCVLLIYLIDLFLGENVQNGLIYQLFGLKIAVAESIHEVLVVDVPQIAPSHPHFELKFVVIIYLILAVGHI